MNILICPDSFKDCMSSIIASQIINDAILEIIPFAKTKPIPLSDGGQGFIAALELAIPNRKITVDVTGPLETSVTAAYLLTEDHRTAIIEMAQAAGLELLTPEQRNPALTTTYGIGELILHALNNYPISKIIIGLGGSASNDGGAGMLQALGVQFLDQNQNPLPLGGIYLKELHSIKMDNLDSRLFAIDIEIASDVINPLTGINGATKVYAHQKGADETMINELEEALLNYSQVMKQLTKQDITTILGSGAAGGLGAGLLLLRGKIISGLEILSKYTNLEQHILESDYVISGEGSVDEQTVNGKTISKVAGYCKQHNKPLIILCGHSHGSLDALYDSGVTAIFAINNGINDLTTALANGKKNLASTSRNIARLWSIVKKPDES